MTPDAAVGDDGSALTVCETMSRCSAIATLQTTTCAQYVADHAASEAAQLAACASCLENVPCDALRDGLCNTQCAPIAGLMEPPDGTITTHRGADSCTMTWNRTRGKWTDPGVFIDVKWCDIDVMYEPRIHAAGDSVDCTRILEPCAPTGTLTAIQRGKEMWVDGSCTCGSYSVELSVPVWFDLPLYISK